MGVLFLTIQQKIDEIQQSCNFSVKFIYPPGDCLSGKSEGACTKRRHNVAVDLDRWLHIWSCFVMFLMVIVIPCHVYDCYTVLVCVCT